MDDEIREAMVEWVLAARWEYLATGANPLRHWDQIQDRVRAAARMACDVPTWVTQVARGLQLGAATPERAAATERIARLVAGRESAWLDGIEAEHGYLIAMARVRAEERSLEARAKREAKGAKREKTTKPAEPEATREASLF